MVLLILVFCPSSARTGGVFSFANLAKAAICGWVTQFGTRIWSRLESYANACVLPNLREILPAGALRIVRIGATSPLAGKGKTDAEAFPRLETHNSRFLVSTNTTVGYLKPVLRPLTRPDSFASPLSVVPSNTMTEWQISLAT